MFVVVMLMQEATQVLAQVEVIRIAMATMLHQEEMAQATHRSAIHQTHVQAAAVAAAMLTMLALVEMVVMKVAVQLELTITAVRLRLLLVHQIAGRAEAVTQEARQEVLIAGQEALLQIQHGAPLAVVQAQAVVVA